MTSCHDMLNNSEKYFLTCYHVDIVGPERLKMWEINCLSMLSLNCDLKSLNEIEAELDLFVSS